MIFEAKVWVVTVGNRYFQETKYVFAPTAYRAEVIAIELFTPYKTQYGDPLVYKPAKVVKNDEKRSTNQRYGKN